MMHYATVVLGAVAPMYLMDSVGIVVRQTWASLRSDPSGRPYAAAVEAEYVATEGARAKPE